MDRTLCTRLCISHTVIVLVHINDNNMLPTHVHEWYKSCKCHIHVMCMFGRICKSFIHSEVYHRMLCYVFFMEEVQQLEL